MIIELAADLAVEKAQGVADYGTIKIMKDALIRIVTKCENASSMHAVAIKALLTCKIEVKKE